MGNTASSSFHNQSTKSRKSKKNTRDDDYENFLFIDTICSTAKSTICLETMNSDDSSTDSTDSYEERSHDKIPPNNSITTSNSISELSSPTPVANKQLSIPLASSFSKKCYFTKLGISTKTPYYEGLTLSGNILFMHPTAMNLKGCPEINDEYLSRAEKEYPNQFSRLPDELVLSSGWKRIEKYCHFSNKPIPDGHPFFYSTSLMSRKDNSQTYFLLASAIGMTRPSDAVPMNKDYLVLLETDFNDTFNTIPKELRDATKWKLVNTFCFFSGGPINMHEDAYYEATLGTDKIQMKAIFVTLSPTDLYKLDEAYSWPKTPAELVEAEKAFDLKEQHFEQLKLLHLGCCRALPHSLLRPDAWQKVLPKSYELAKNKALERIHKYETSVSQKVNRNFHHRADLDWKTNNSEEQPNEQLGMNLRRTPSNQSRGAGNPNPYQSNGVPPPYQNSNYSTYSSAEYPPALPPLTTNLNLNNSMPSRSQSFSFSNMSNPTKTQRMTTPSNYQYHPQTVQAKTNETGEDATANLPHPNTKHHRTAMTQGTNQTSLADTENVEMKLPSNRNLERNITFPSSAQHQQRNIPTSTKNQGKSYLRRAWLSTEQVMDEIRDDQLVNKISDTTKSAPSVHPPPFLTTHPSAEDKPALASYGEEITNPDQDRIELGEGNHTTNNDEKRMDDNVMPSTNFNENLDRHDNTSSMSEDNQSTTFQQSSEIKEETNTERVDHITNAHTSHATMSSIKPKEQLLEENQVELKKSVQKSKDDRGRAKQRSNMKRPIKNSSPLKKIQQKKKGNQNESKHQINKENEETNLTKPLSDYKRTVSTLPKTEPQMTETHDASKQNKQEMKAEKSEAESLSNITGHKKNVSSFQEVKEKAQYTEDGHERENHTNDIASPSQDSQAASQSAPNQTYEQHETPNHIEKSNTRVGHANFFTFASYGNSPLNSEKETCEESKEYESFRNKIDSSDTLSAASYPTDSNTQNDTEGFNMDINSSINVNKENNFTEDPKLIKHKRKLTSSSIMDLSIDKYELQSGGYNEKVNESHQRTNTAPETVVKSTNSSDRQISLYEKKEYTRIISNPNAEKSKRNDFKMSHYQDERNTHDMNNAENESESRASQRGRAPHIAFQNHSIDSKKEKFLKLPKKFEEDEVKAKTKEAQSKEISSHTKDGTSASLLMVNTKDMSSQLRTESSFMLSGEEYYSRPMSHDVTAVKGEFTDSLVIDNNEGEAIRKGSSRYYAEEMLNLKKVLNSGAKPGISKSLTEPDLKIESVSGSFSPISESTRRGEKKISTRNPVYSPERSRRNHSLEEKRERERNVSNELKKQEHNFIHQFLVQDSDKVLAEERIIPRKNTSDTSESQIHYFRDNLSGRDCKTMPKHATEYPYRKDYENILTRTPMEAEGQSELSLVKEHRVTDRINLFSEENVLEDVHGDYTFEDDVNYEKRPISIGKFIEDSQTSLIDTLLEKKNDEAKHVWNLDLQSFQESQSEKYPREKRLAVKPSSAEQYFIEDDLDSYVEDVTPQVNFSELKESRSLHLEPHLNRKEISRAKPKDSNFVSFQNIAGTESASTEESSKLESPNGFGKEADYYSFSHHNLQDMNSVSDTGDSRENENFSLYRRVKLENNQDILASENNKSHDLISPVSQISDFGSILSASDKSFVDMIKKSLKTVKASSSHENDEKSRKLFKMIKKQFLDIDEDEDFDMKKAEVMEVNKEVIQPLTKFDFLTEEGQSILSESAIGPMDEIDADVGQVLANEGILHKESSSTEDSSECEEILARLSWNDDNSSDRGEYEMKEKDFDAGLSLLEDIASRLEEVENKINFSSDYGLEHKRKGNGVLSMPPDTNPSSALDEVEHKAKMSSQKLRKNSRRGEGSLFSELNNKNISY